MSNNTTTYSGGLSFPSLLTLVFVTLKLTGVSPVALWSWWWVLSPLWISFGIVFVLLLIVGAIALAVANK